MGKGQKGKGNTNAKPTKNFKKRSAENLKQLARIQNIKGRSQSNSKQGRRQNFSKDIKDQSRSKSKKDFNKPGDKNNQTNSYKKDFSKDNKKDFNSNKRDLNSNKRDLNSNKRDLNSNKRDLNSNKKDLNSNKKDFSSNKQSNKGDFSQFKTKQISKGSKGKGGKRFQQQQDQQKQQIMKPLKGNPLFKIIPQGMDQEDQFVALSGLQPDYDEEDGQEGDFDQEDEQQGDELQDDQQQADQEQGDEDQGQQSDQEQGDFNDEEAIEGEEDQFDEDDQQDQQDQSQEQQQQPKRKSKHIVTPLQDQAEEQQMADQGQQNNNQNQPVDISVISLKIQQTIQILMNVQNLGGGKPRKHYIEELKKMIHQYYGYNFELISHFLDFFNPSEMIQFFESNETQRPLTIRTNTLKTRRKELAQNLIQRGVNLDPLAEWSNVGIKIYETKVPIGATPEYLAGHYMLQSASSLLPVIALDPQVGQKILDMASAPGGKTTYIAQMMKNTGCVFANDLKKERLRALQFNLYRLGITNTAVICRDGKKMPAIFPGTFDRVLLDAPCTGLGIISKDHSIKANRMLLDIYKNSHLQKQLLLAAIDCCKVNGVIVYSTCSVSPLENEEVVNYALKKRFVKIVDCEVEVGEQGLTKFVEKRFHVDLKKTRRIYPHVHNMDGFYVAKLVKVAKGKRQTKQGEDHQDCKAIDDILNESVDQQVEQ